MSELCVLITNHSLCRAGGSEMYVIDLATRLLERGHIPVVYSPRLGRAAERLLHATVPVIDDLNQMGRMPDVMHCHHTLASMAALLQFPDAPAVYICHDWAWHHDTPPKISRIRKWIAVDRTVCQRMSMREGRAPGEVLVLSNGVDLRRFQQRPPLPEVPRRALVFSNYMTAPHVEAVTAACRQHGITVDAVGRAIGRPCDFPEKLLQNYDLVFAKGRCAWEAMACGAGLIVCDAVGVGEFIAPSNWEKNVARNFGRRMLRKPFDTETISAEVSKYHAADATRVCELVREQADLDRIVDRLIELYREAIAEHLVAPATDYREELRDMSRLVAYCDRAKELWQTNFDAGAAMTERQRRGEQAENPAQFGADAA